MTTLRRIGIGILIAAPFLCGPAAAQENSLYQRLGGYDAIAAVTNDFIGRLATDPKLARFFVGFSADSKMRIRQRVVDLICKTSGGPCYYLGRDVKISHKDAGITKEDRDRSVALFKETLAKFKVGEDLPAIIMPLEKDIVD